MSGSVIWRKAGFSDARDIALMHHDSWQATYSGIYPRSFLDARPVPFFHGRWEAYLEDESRPVIIAVLDRTISGLLRYAPDGEICGLYVLPEVQRQGVGDTLLEEAELDLTRIGNKELRTSVVKANTPAQSFFEHKGFVVSRNYEATWDGNPVVLVELTKDLSSLARGRKA